MKEILFKITRSKTIKNRAIDVYKYSKNIISFESMIFTNIIFYFRKGIFFMKIAELHFEF